MLNHLVHQLSKPIRALLFLTFLVELLALVPMVYMLSLFQRAIPTGSYATLISLTLFVVGAYILWGTLEWVRSQILARVALRLDWDHSPDVFDAVFRAQLQKQAINPHQIMSDLSELRSFVSGPCAVAALSLPFAVIFIAFAGFIHPWLAGFMAIMLTALAFSAYLSQRSATPILRAANDSAQAAAQSAGIFGRFAEVTSTLGMQPAARARWYQSHRNSLGLGLAAKEAQGLTQGVSGFINRSMADLAKALVAVLAISGTVDPSFVFIAAMLIAKTAAPINVLLTNWAAIVKARQSGDRIQKLLADYPPAPESMSLPPPKGRLLVDNVAGGPPNSDKELILGVSFSLEPGSCLAIAGVSGAGKSTLAKLLLGLYKPSSGSVRLDGVEVSTWPHVALGRHLGYVSQEVVFFEGTVAENIARLGEPDSEKVIRAAQAAGIHELILRFPQGYDTPLGDAAKFGLSGGQRQRLAIARALYGEPKFIVMDEPNANLDEKGEADLVATIHRLRQAGATVVITTHRPRVIGAADQVLIIKQGKSVMFGPTQTVIDRIRALKAGNAGHEESLSESEREEVLQQLPTSASPRTPT